MFVKNSTELQKMKVKLKFASMRVCMYGILSRLAQLDLFDRRDQLKII